VLNGTKPWYKSPLQFFFTVAVYVIVLARVLAPYASQLIDPTVTALVQPLALSGWLATVIQRNAVSAVLVLATISAPAWMLLLSAGMLALAFAYEVSRVLTRHRGFYAVTFPILNLHLYAVPLDPRLYPRLAANRFWWALFYFGLVAAVVLLIMWTLLKPLDAITDAMIAKGVNPANPVMAVPYAVLLWLFQRFLFVPYVFMLRASLPSPTLRMLKADAYVVNEILRELNDRQNKSKRYGTWSDQVLAGWLLRSWVRAESRLGPELGRLERIDPSGAVRMKSQLRQVFGEFEAQRTKELFHGLSLKGGQRYQAESFVRAMFAIESGNGLIGASVEMPSSPSKSNQVVGRKAALLIARCEKCHTKVIPMADGRCPSCHALIEKSVL
jgi:hypothetical protein